jgi:2-oxoglutarate dehydrogenase E2 component (dihydrolipoamide succinyltransferase)
MAKVDIIMPAMGEGIIEATITRIIADMGSRVEQDDPIVELATDKVDSEICAPVSGVIVAMLCKEGDVVSVGKSIAVVSTDSLELTPEIHEALPDIAEELEVIVPQDITPQIQTLYTTAEKFLSPLVKNIVRMEQIQNYELDSIEGTGFEGRITKDDLVKYLAVRKIAHAPNLHTIQERPAVVEVPKKSVGVPTSQSETIVEMDRMRRLIADHMVDSKRLSPHVTSFVEVDMTNVVKWRESNKAAFEQKYGEKLSFMPFFIEATAKALRDFPMVNVSVSGYQIIKKNNINIGFATALPDGNLIVPVIKHADGKNLAGLATALSGLVSRARTKNLRPDEITGGTFSITNVGTFGNITGTPIINQPESAILAVGAIQKKPAVIETPYGDSIGIKQLMIMSLSFDHRAIDGFLGGSFLKQVANYLDNFDLNRKV